MALRSIDRTGFVTIDDDPFSVDYLTDPFPAHERMRQAGSVFCFRDYEVFGMARYTEVYEAMRDWRTYSSAPGVGLNDRRESDNPVLPRPLTLEIDPPEHGKYRQFLSKTLSRNNLTNMEAEAVSKADRLVKRIIDKGIVDVADDIAAAYVLEVFCDAIGFRNDHRERFLDYSHAVFNSFGPENGLREKTDRVGIELYPWILENCERESLRPDGIGMFIYEAADRGEIEEKESQLLIRPLLSAGIDTTVSAIGSTVLGLVQNPEQWDLLKNNPDLAPAAYEEGIRWMSPVQAFFRTTTRPVEVDGRIIPKDAKVLMVIGAANRDPSRWERPSEFRIDRPKIAHMGFGSGIHACVGQAIARIEGVAILSALASNIETIEPVSEPTYKLNNSTRSLDHFAVRVTPRP